MRPATRWGLCLVASLELSCGRRLSLGCVDEDGRTSQDKDGVTHCCEDLTEIAVAFPVGDTDDVGTWGGSPSDDLPEDCLLWNNFHEQVSTRCGDGTCGVSENRCNCAADCGG